MYHQALISPSRWGLLRRAIGFALVWSLASGAVFIPGVWAATFYVDAGSGDDDNDGSSGAPWKTITQAISEATLAPGDDIQVGAGTYDPTLGEIFPLTLVDGVALIGDPDNPDTRVIDPPPGAHAFFNDNTPLADTTVLSGFRINHDTGLYGDDGMKFDVGSVAMAPQILNNVFVGNAALTNGNGGIAIRDTNRLPRSFTSLIENNIFVDLGDAVAFQADWDGATADFSPTVRGNTFTDCRNPFYISMTGSFSGTVSPEIVGNTATGSGYDIYLDAPIGSGHGPTFAPLINNNTFSGSDYASLYMSVGTMSLSSSTDTLTFSPTILNNTITDAGEKGMHFYFDDLSYCNFASDMTIAGNTITNPGSDGIYLEMTNFSSGHSMFVDWTISNNTITFAAAGNDYGIRVEGTSYLDVDYGGHLNLTVAGNSVTGDNYNGIGISLSEFYDAELSLSFTVAGNTVTGSSADGMYLMVKSQTSALDNRMDILDNVIEGNLGNGLNFRTDDYPLLTSYIEIACNTIVNNGGHGVWHYRFGGGDPPPDWGGGDLGSPGLNTLMGNGTVSGFDFFNGHPDSVSAHSNWWGSDDPGVIDGNISDDNEGTGGAVDYSNFLSEAPTVSATATLVDAIEVDLSPPGPSEGDTIRYTATLQGSGDCGCASALFTVEMPSNGFFIPNSLTADRGILINESISTIHPELKVGLGALEASETVTITWDVMAGAGCSMTSQATLSCYQLGDLLTDDPDVGGATDPTTTLLGTDLAISKSDGLDTAAPGDSTSYTIAVTSTCDAVGATVTDTFPTAFTGVSWTCTPSAGSSCGTGAGNISDTVSILAGGTLTYTADGAINPLFTGDLVNTATVTAPAGLTELDPNNNSDSDTTTVILVGSPDIAAGKTVAGSFIPGGFITYTIVLSNTGAAVQPDNPTDEFLDILPSELTLLSAGATSGVAAVDIPSRTVTWNGGIPGSQSVTITIKAVIGSGVPVSSTISNQGTAYYDSDLDGANESSVLTDDPGVGGATDPTDFLVQEVLFADGFESGGTTLWSNSVP